MLMRSSPLQRKRACVPSTAPPIVHEVLRSAGRPLDPKSRALIEPGFGHDFSRVIIHTDARAAESARAVDARAYTVGSHITFAEGEFAPGTSEGRRLLTHELTHVMQQQAAAGVTPASEIRIGQREDRWEEQADDFVRQTLTKRSSPNKQMASSASPLSLQKSPDDDAGKKSVPTAEPAGKKSRHWSTNDLLIWLFAEHDECSFGADVQGGGSVEGFGPPGHRTCETSLRVYEGEEVPFHLRFGLEASDTTYPHSKEPLEKISYVSALFVFTTTGGQRTVLLNGKDSAPRYDDKWGFLNANLGSSLEMRNGLIIPLRFPANGTLQVLAQMEYAGPPAVNLLFDDLIDVEVTPSSPGTETGIYLHVPDPKNAPLVYKRITGHEGWQQKGIIVSVWSDDRGYYYNGKNGRIRLPERP